MYPTVYVWQGGQLVSPTTLPQFNATTGANVQSLQITNNSDVTLVFALERATPVTILPRYRLTAPCIPNSQYNLSMATGSATSADTKQYVTLTETTEASAFVLEPLNTDVVIAGGTVAITGTADVNVLNTPSVNVTGTPNVNIANSPTVAVSGGAVNATITAGTVDIQNVTGGIIAAAGQLQYLGSQALGTTTYTITNTAQRALVIVMPPPSVGGQEFLLTVRGHTLPIYAVGSSVIGIPLAGSATAIAYINPDADTGWDVIISHPAGALTTVGFVFADTGFPMVDIPRLGLQSIYDSIPVSVAVPETTSYSSYPAAGAAASVTIPAGLGRYRLTSMRFRLLSRGAADLISIRVNGSLSGALFTDRLQVPATSGATDDCTMTNMGLLSIAGESLTLSFLTNPAAGNYCTINVTADYTA